MTEQGIDLADKFLQRVDIKGSEVPAFNLVLNELFQEREAIKAKAREAETPKVEAETPKK